MSVAHQNWLVAVCAEHVRRGAAAIAGETDQDALARRVYRAPLGYLR